MTLTYNQKRFIVLIRKRAVTDTLAWIILWLLTIGYIPIHIYSKYDSNFDYFQEWVNCVTQQVYPNIDFTSENWFVPILMIFRETGLYIIAIMIMVYINLNLIKKYTLDKKGSRPFRYLTYLSFTAATSIGLAVIWYGITNVFPNLVCMRVEGPREAIFHFAFALISTALVYTKDLKDIQNRNEELEEELRLIESNPEAEFPHVFDDHIKVGSKNNWKLIYFKDILFLKAHNNDTRIHTEIGTCWGGTSIGDFEEILPSSLFIRISRSYLISKAKVTSRTKMMLCIRNQKGEKIEEVKITESYKEKVNQDAHLGFEK